MLVEAVVVLYLLLLSLSIRTQVRISHFTLFFFFLLFFLLFSNCPLRFSRVVRFLEVSFFFFFFFSRSVTVFYLFFPLQLVIEHQEMSQPPPPQGNINNNDKENQSPPRVDTAASSFKMRCNESPEMLSPPPSPLQSPHTPCYSPASTQPVQGQLTISQFIQKINDTDPKWQEGKEEEGEEETDVARLALPVLRKTFQKQDETEKVLSGEEGPDEGFRNCRGGCEHRESWR